MAPNPSVAANPKREMASMQIMAFEQDGKSVLGVRDGEAVVVLGRADPGLPGDLGQLLQAEGSLDRISLALQASDASDRRPLADLRPCLPVARPGKILCLGINYAAHAAEGGHETPPYPTVFMRAATSLVAHGQPIVRPQCSERLDYEAEVAVVIGRRARHLDEASALKCIAGYSCFNDGSIRDYQRKTTQWTMGKNFDRTGGFGPWLVTPDELPAGAVGLRIQSRLNGQVMQDANTDAMLFPVARTLALLSECLTLEPGDVVVTGTPEGVGHARKPPVWMRAGDVIEVEVEGIGVLRNPIIDEVGRAM